ncbi:MULTISPECIES: hypothetical protein [unclassified Actinopolyspora]|uniref:hypothetical protein n=1 Tax=Actinopolyspora TaxID=1849 RepID=UPI001A98B2CC|nr:MULTISPECIES: hypothetical protein [unclassified Actinopolyspora]
MMSVGTRLVVSLHGIGGAEALDRCERFAADMQARGVALSLLVAPAELTDPAVSDWLLRRRARGDFPVLHGVGGVFHHAESAFDAPRFLPRHEAGLWLAAANAVLEARGLSTEVFAVRANRVSDGTLRALRESGFGLCAGPAVLHDLRAEATHRVDARVFTGPRGEVGRCRALRLGTERSVLAGRWLTRLAVSAADLLAPRRRLAVADAVDGALARGAVPVTYDQLVPRERAPRPVPGTRGGIPNPDPLTS